MTIDLLWDSDDAFAATNAGEETTINGPVRVATDSDGYWIVEDLDLNGDITPADNVYSVSEYADSETITYYVTLPSSGSHWLGDVLVTQPTWVED